ncbi:hypothetical protein AMS68_001215 [Peltaster fructicola]|uniref:NAD(P)-binding domain-containing protein n=1 Tax=Peltaster fructicola TaxID=286661 RepID=A0A6H0XM51_9PEZI|nr:hypothetical protein AMS68_001215 [Peltaster fructicola]
MHILVVGATGPSGVAFIDTALQAGHELTIYARSPKKLSWEVLNNPKVHLVEGSFEDADAARKAVVCGAEALVSCAGPVFGNSTKGTPIADFYARIYKLIQSEDGSKIRRCLILSTPSYPSSKDGSSLRLYLIVMVIWTLVNFMYNEIIASSKVTAAQPADQIGWTIYRVPILTNSAARPVHAGYKGDGKDGIFLSRQSLAVWLVQELKDSKWIGQEPLLSDA